MNAIATDAKKGAATSITLTRGPEEKPTTAPQKSDAVEAASGQDLAIAHQGAHQGAHQADEAFASVSFSTDIRGNLLDNTGKVIPLPVQRSPQEMIDDAQAITASNPLTGRPAVGDLRISNEGTQSERQATENRIKQIATNQTGAAQAFDEIASVVNTAKKAGFVSDTDLKRADRALGVLEKANNESQSALDSLATLIKKAKLTQMKSVNSIKEGFSEAFGAARSAIGKLKEALADSARRLSQPAFDPSRVQVNLGKIPLKGRDMRGQYLHKTDLGIEKAEHIATINKERNSRKILSAVNGLYKEIDKLRANLGKGRWPIRRINDGRTQRSIAEKEEQIRKLMKTYKEERAWLQQTAKETIKRLEGLQYTRLSAKTSRLLDISSVPVGKSAAALSSDTLMKNIEGLMAAPPEGITISKRELTGEILISRPKPGGAEGEMQTISFIGEAQQGASTFRMHDGKLYRAWNDKAMTVIQNFIENKKISVGMPKQEDRVVMDVSKKPAPTAAVPV